MQLDIHVGLSPLETPVTDLRELRRLIAEGRRDSSLIQGALIEADMAGYNGEDRYTLLAFRALVAAELYYKRCVEMCNLMPTPPIISLGERR